MTALRSALDSENVTDSTGRSMCFTCFLGFFGSEGASFSLPFLADDFLVGSSDFPLSSAGLSVVSAGLSVVSAGFFVEPSVVSFYYGVYI